MNSPSMVRCMKYQLSILAALTVCCALSFSAQPNGAQKKNPQKPGTTDVPKDKRQQKTSSEPSSEQAEQGQDDVVRVDTSLVMVPVIVTDRKGNYVVDLAREDFHIHQDGIEQEINYFSPASLSPADKPFTIALLLDVSDSTQVKLQRIQDAAIAFVDQLQPDDSVIVVSFDQSVEVLAEMTRDRLVLHDAIHRAKMDKGGTSLYNAIDMTIHQRLNNISGRRAIVLLTDGVDTTSVGATSLSSMRAAEAAGISVYSLQYDTVRDEKSMVNSVARRSYPGGPTVFSTPVQNDKSRKRAFEEATVYLRTIADITGGRFYSADGVADLARAFARVAEELRQQYVLAYYPSVVTQRGEHRRLKVSVNRPGLKIRARSSYAVD